MSSELDKANDGSEKISEPEGTVTPMFCPTCDHPPGYHHPERGCTMPLDSAGLPVTRTVQTVGACYCGESMQHKRERLRTAMYAAKAVFKDAERAYTEELHAQRVETAQQSLVKAPETFDPDDYESWPLERPRAAYRADYEGGRSGTGDVNLVIYAEYDPVAAAKLRARNGNG